MTATGVGRSWSRTVLDVVSAISIAAVSTTAVWFMLTSRTATSGASPTKARAAQVHSRQPSSLQSKVISIRNAHIMGLQSAPVALIEYGDYQCPACRDFAVNTLPTLKRDYVDTGKLAFVMLNRPLTRIHPQAELAAQAAECAGVHNRFWPMYNALYQNQASLTLTGLTTDAASVGIPAKSFGACLAGPPIASIQADSDAAIAMGINSTPTLLLGRIQSAGSVRVIDTMIGSKPLAFIRSALDVQLAGAGAARHQ